MLGIAESCKSKFDEKKYLTELLNNLEQVKSVSYFHTQTGKAPPYNKWYMKEFANPADTAAGVKYGIFFPDTTMYIYYDGNARVQVEDHLKRIVIDSLESTPFRSAGVFFNNVKNIIKNALNPKDSISTEFQDFGDSLLFSLNVYSDKRVGLGNKWPFYSVDSTRTVYYFNNPTPRNEISEYIATKYDVWISKSTGLPYRLEGVLSSSGVVSDVQINQIDIEDFIPSRDLPPDYDIMVYHREVLTLQQNLTGTIAPDWTLSDYNNETFSLKDFKSKVLLIEFSGIGCGPCQAAIPFLHQLVNDYKDKSFELVRIEGWSKNIDVIKEYCLKYEITYKFLIADKEVSKKYNVFGVPVFFILDSNKKIQKIVLNYEGEKTNKEIKEAIEKLL